MYQPDAWPIGRVLIALLVAALVTWAVVWAGLVGVS